MSPFFGNTFAERVRAAAKRLNQIELRKTYGHIDKPGYETKEILVSLISDYDLNQRSQEE